MGVESTFRFPSFYVEPDDGLTEILYDLKLASGGSPPSWLSFTVEDYVMEFTIEASCVSGSYDFTLRATAAHDVYVGFIDTLLENFSVVIVSRENNAPYWIEEIPTSWPVEFGEFFEYITPTYLDDENDEITLSVDLGPAATFMNYDPSIGNFSISQGATTDEDVGSYTLNLNLADSLGYVLETQITVEIIDPSAGDTESDDGSIGDFFAALLFMDNLPTIGSWDWGAEFAKLSGSGNVKPLPPEIKLTEISKVGLVRLQFSKEMVVPPLEVIQSVRALSE